jgi:hypothetical protein
MNTLASKQAFLSPSLTMVHRIAFPPFKSPLSHFYLSRLPPLGTANAQLYF